MKRFMEVQVLSSAQDKIVLLSNVQIDRYNGLISRFNVPSAFQASPEGKIEPKSTLIWLIFDLLYVSPRSASSVLINVVTSSFYEYSTIT